MVNLPHAFGIGTDASPRDGALHSVFGNMKVQYVSAQSDLVIKVQYVTVDIP